MGAKHEARPLKPSGRGQSPQIWRQAGAVADARRQSKLILTATATVLPSEVSAVSRSMGLHWFADVLIHSGHADAIPSSRATRPTSRQAGFKRVKRHPADLLRRVGSRREHLAQSPAPCKKLFDLLPVCFVHQNHITRL